MVFSTPRQPISPFSGVQPNLLFDSPDTIIDWIKDGKTNIEDWDWAARVLKMSVDELRRQVEF